MKSNLTESSPRSQRQGWLLVGALVLLSAILFLVDFAPARTAAHEVEAAAGFQRLAVLSDVVLDFAPGLGENTAVFIGTLTPGSNSQLIALDLTTGEARWQVTGSDQLRPYFWPQEWTWQWPFAWQWGPVIVVGDQVVAADAFMLTTSVNSFDIMTGEPGWQRAIGNINGSDIGYLAVADDAIAIGIDVDGYTEFQILDSGVGFRQARRQKDAGNIFWVEPEPLRVFEAFANQIRVTGENAWQQSVSGCEAQPVLLPAQIIVKTNPCGEGENRGQPGIFALSRETGQLLWQLNQGVVSNLVVDGERIVGLMSDANLVVIDAVSGVVLGMMPFSPLEFDADPDFFVAARDGLVAVYFGDSRELAFVRYR